MHNALLPTRPCFATEHPLFISALVRACAAIRRQPPVSLRILRSVVLPAMLLSAVAFHSNASFIFAQVTQTPVENASAAQEPESGSDQATTSETSEPAVPSDSALARYIADVTFMADDAMQGRDTFSPGAEATVQYMIEDFKRYGIKSAVADGSYRQPFEVNLGTTLDASSVNLSFRGTADVPRMTLDRDYKPQMVGGSGSFDGEVVFVGYGIEDEENGYQEYKDVSVDGKVVLMLRRQPLFEKEDSPYARRAPGEKAFIRNKLAQAESAGAVGVIFVNDLRTARTANEDFLGTYATFGTMDQGLPFVFISQLAFNRMLAAQPLQDADGNALTDLVAVSDVIDNTMQPLSQPMGNLQAQYNAEFKEITGWGYNVCGVIEGEGPLANQTIIIGAHYDHLGLGGDGSRTRDRDGEVYNGADDNATGTAAVMELARRFAQAEKKPSRRLVFIGFSGEERGLLGSYHYVDNPIYPLESTVAMINFDMIGWLRQETVTLFGAETSEVWPKCAEVANQQFQFNILEQNANVGGSDHLPFTQRGIPGVFIHTGLTPTYHTPDDDTSTLDLPGAVKVVDFSEAFVEALLEQPEIAYAQRTRPARRSAYLGVRLDFENIEEEGLKILAVTEDSPAAVAGMQVGDILSDLDGEKMASRDSVSKVLGAHQSGDTIAGTLVRDGESISVEITLGSSGR